MDLTGGPIPHVTLGGCGWAAIHKREEPQGTGGAEDDGGGCRTLRA